MLLSAGLTATSFFWLHHTEHREWDQRFLQRAETIDTLFDLRCSSADDDLTSLRVLFENSAAVTAEEFEYASRALRATDPDLAALEWVPVVRGADRAAFEQNLRAGSYPDFAIVETEPGGKPKPAASADEYWPVTYISPYEPNRIAHGFDLHHGPTVAALTRARSSRSLAASAPLRLVQTSGDTASVIFILPVFRQPDDVFMGWVQSIVHAPVLVRIPCEEAQRLGLLVAFDSIDPATGIAQRLHASPGIDTTAGQPRHTGVQEHGGRRWSVSVWPDSEFLAARNTARPWLALIGGAATTLLLALFVRTTARRAHHIERLVERRTRELTGANRALSGEIAQRHRAEEARARDLLIFASVRDAIVVTDPAGTITFWNAGAVTLFGWSAAEMLGQPFFQRFATEYSTEAKQEILAAVAAGRDWCGEWAECRKDGSRLWVDMNLRRFLDAHGQPAGCIGLAYDVTGRRQAQEARLEVDRRLRDAQKLESLGVLAGGIAHDFNNLLTSVLGQASLLRLDLPATSPMHDNLAAIETSALHAADLCQQMLAYSGCARCALRHLDLGALVEETTRLARASLGPNVQLALAIAPGLSPVYADPIQLRQIVMNLVLNASDALGDQPGTITVATSLMHANRAQLDATLLGAGLAEADYCLIEVRDTGCGMTAETLARIFEPFFTTKFTGRGLGLSAVLGIARTHHGTLQVESAPGQGSRFRILLPVAQRAAAEPAQAMAAPGRSPMGAQRILVVDDEHSVRETAQLMLRASGYPVDLAEDGQAALEALGRTPHDYALVLLDYAMPRLDGAQTLAALRRIAPTLPVVLMSGFGEQEAFERFGPHGPATFLQKPFSATTLLELIRHHLAPPPAG